MSPRLNFRHHRVVSAALAALFVISATDVLRDASDRFDELLHGKHYVFASFDIDLLTFGVNELQPGAEQAGLRMGDVILGVNGHPVHGYSDIAGAVRQARTGDRLVLHVRRISSGNLAEHDISVPLIPFTYVGLPADSPAYMALILVRIVTPLLCLALGFWVAAVRLRDRAAWALLFLMLSVANLVSDERTAFGNQDALQPFLTGFAFFCIRIGPLALAYFALVFPEPLAFDRRYPWVKWIVATPMLLRAGLHAIAGALMANHHDIGARFWRIVLMFDHPGDWVELGAIAFFFIVLGYRTITAGKGDARRRLLLLDTGTALGLVPFLLMLMWNAFFNLSFRGWSGALSIGALLIFPLTMAYAIVVQRAMDVRVVIRQGVQHLLATSGVRILQVVISAAIVVFAATMTADTGVATRIGLISVGFALLAGIGGFAARLRSWIDRQFFREAYEADTILSDLATRVRTVAETGPLLEMVADRIAAALHVPRIAILLDGNGAFVPAYAVGYSEPLRASLLDDSATLRRLKESHHAQVNFEDAGSWVQSTDGEERAALEELRPGLLLPLSLQDKVIGIMCLGPKQSEEPFSSTDLRLLDSVAAQTGLALENGRLTDAIKAEVREREKQDRELELARQVQERLFPKKAPKIPGLDIAGLCCPAQTIGGDYYDFVSIPTGGFGVAIGDIAGKGVPAALLMAGLQASLRGLVSVGLSQPAALLEKLNPLIYDATPANRFATFFYGIYDPATRCFRYSSAGHNPALLCRAGSDEPVWLNTKGLALGLRRQANYEQSELILEPGDKLVLYTDGVSEARNEAGEEFGEQRLYEAARTSTSPASILKSVMEFVGDALQHDDITLILAQSPGPVG